MLPPDGAQLLLSVQFAGELSTRRCTQREKQMKIMQGSDSSSSSCKRQQGLNSGFYYYYCYYYFVFGVFLACLFFLFSSGLRFYFPPRHPNPLFFTRNLICCEQVPSRGQTKEHKEGFLAVKAASFAPAHEAPTASSPPLGALLGTWAPSLGGASPGASLLLPPGLILLMFGRSWSRNTFSAPPASLQLKFG